MPLGKQAVHHLFENGHGIAERELKGRYWVQKHNGSEWRDMSAGDARPTAGPGRELDHMKRQVRVLGGRCRIVKRSTTGASVVVWPEGEQS